MLNLQFQIQGDADDKLLVLQAKGIVAALYAIYGDKVLPVPTRYTAKAVNVLVQSTADAPVGDGIEQEPDAATAFAHADAVGIDPDPAAAFGGNDPTTQTTSPTGAVERDKNGIPWDKRIHASTQTKNADGTWTRRRNTPDDTFNSVMAELRAANTTRTMEAAAGIVPPPPPPSVPAPPTASPAPSPTPAAPAASSTAPGAVSFPDVMRKITGAQAAGKLTPDNVTNLLASIGANPPAVSSLAKDASLIPGFIMLLDDHLAMQG